MMPDNEAFQADEPNADEPNADPAAQSPDTPDGSVESEQVSTGGVDDANVVLPVHDITFGSMPQATQFIDFKMQRALSEKAPEKFLDFLAGFDKRQYEYNTRLAEHRYQEQQSRQHTVRYALGIVLAAIVCSLIYAQNTQDKDLPDKIIDTLIGALGGAGTLALVARSQKEES